ncbi:MAG TPA: hypothetical protein VKB10_07690 [Gaiellaceae bacterium]|nr:hypothetical protein [Gaiellaceae bacterium]
MQRRNLFALASVAVAVLLAAVGTFRGDDAHASRQFLIVCAVIAVAAGVVFWLIVPRIERLDRGALVFGIVALLSIVVFWLGLPPILAGAAALLALASRERGAETRQATAALVLAALALAAAVIIAFVG